MRRPDIPQMFIPIVSRRPQVDASGCSEGSQLRYTLLSSDAIRQWANDTYIGGEDEPVI